VDFGLARQDMEAWSRPRAASIWTLLERAFTGPDAVLNKRSASIRGAYAQRGRNKLSAGLPSSGVRRRATNRTFCAGQAQMRSGLRWRSTFGPMSGAGDPGRRR